MAFDLFPPDVMVIHLGDNSLSVSSGKVLILDIWQGHKWLNARYPAMRITWSTIILWLAQWDIWNIGDVNKARGALTYLVEVSATAALTSCEADCVMRIVWSMIIPRLAWWGAWIIANVNKARGALTDGDRGVCSGGLDILRCGLCGPRLFCG